MPVVEVSKRALRLAAAEAADNQPPVMPEVMPAPLHRTFVVSIRLSGVAGW
ncbi:hypothetical protein [Nocardia vulneris]|uniref:hypothetical protein n=1 Tax=Nocardia vulneris TaxID=1141657 RepID=UPI0012E06299|nr:hypothetical protein [Nocardia vulneris]